MNQSPTIGALAAALAKAQGSYEVAVKDAANPFFKSKYLTLAGALDAVRDALSANGLAVVQQVDAAEKLVLHSTLLHASGEWIASSYPINPVKADPQGIGSAVSYARRYSLMALVGLAAEDDDGEAAHGRQHAQPAHSPAPAKKDNPLSEHFFSATKRGVSKDALLALAAGICGHPVAKAGDIEDEHVEPVIKAWKNANV
jgi:hypothetical protein